MTSGGSAGHTPPLPSDTHPLTREPSLESNDRDQLRRMLLDRSMRFGEFVLSSGATSDYYIDVRKTSLHPQGLEWISRLFWDLVAEDVTRLIELAEEWAPADDKAAVPRMTRTDEEDALEFLKDPSLFNRILGDFETIGLTGEEANKLVGYVAATSRKLDDPISVLVQSRSAAGKSTLQDAVISLMQKGKIRFASEPSYRLGDLGFRVAAVPLASSRNQQPGQAEPGAQAEG